MGKGKVKGRKGGRIGRLLGLLLELRLRGLGRLKKLWRVWVLGHPMRTSRRASYITVSYDMIILIL